MEAMLCLMGMDNGCLCFRLLFNVVEWLRECRGACFRE